MWCKARRKAQQKRAIASICSGAAGNSWDKVPRLRTVRPCKGELLPPCAAGTRQALSIYPLQFTDTYWTYQVHR